MSVTQDLGPDDDDSRVAWKQQLCLSRARLRSTSLAVLEVNRRVPEGAAADQGPSTSGQVEVVAWAFAKIIQVDEYRNKVFPSPHSVWFDHLCQERH